MNRAHFTAAIISLGMWLACFIGWICVLLSFLDAAETMTGQGQAQGAVIFGVIWAFICHYLGSRVIAMSIWVEDEWTGRE